MAGHCTLDFTYWMSNKRNKALLVPNPTKLPCWLAWDILFLFLARKDAFPKPCLPIWFLEMTKGREMIGGWSYHSGNGDRGKNGYMPYRCKRWWTPGLREIPMDGCQENIDRTSDDQRFEDCLGRQELWEMDEAPLIVLCGVNYIVPYLLRSDNSDVPAMLYRSTGSPALWLTLNKLS